MSIKDYLIQFYVQQNGEVITPELAKMLVEEMAVTDGSGRANGEKWNIDECLAVGDNVGIDWNRINKAEWYLVLNMLYSDYYLIEKKYGLTSPNYYVDMALCWFNDVDGKENKTFKYFFS